MASAVSRSSSSTPKAPPTKSASAPSRSSTPTSTSTPRRTANSAPRSTPTSSSNGQSGTSRVTPSGNANGNGGFTPSRELRESRQSPSTGGERSESVRSLTEAWSTPEPTSSSSETRAEEGITPLDVASATAKGADGAQGTREFRDAAAEAHRTEVNRPGRGRTGVDEFRDTRDQLRRDGHQVERSTGRRANGEHIADREVHSQSRYQVDSETGPDGRSRVRQGGWVPPADPRAPAANVTVGEQGLQTSRVTNGSNGGVGGFSAPQGSLDGLTRAEIQEKLALDQRPTHISSVQHEPGAQLRQSVVGAQPGHNQAGGQGSQFEHVDRSRASVVPGSETRLHDGNVRASRVAGALDDVGRAFRPLGVITDTLQIADAIQQDGGTVGSNTVREATNVAGGWAGGVAGAQAGAALGAAVGTVVPIVGNVVGGLVGGVVGGIAGSLLGGNLGNWLWG